MAKKGRDNGNAPRRRRRRGTSLPTLPPIDRDGRFRPILGKGERLAFPVDAVGGGGDAWHPRSLEGAFAALTPQVRQVAEQVAALPDRLRGPHVIIEAKLLPNYLAGSHYPQNLLDYVQLYPVGSRQSRGTYVTRKRAPRENEPTKTYLLAGDDAAVRRLATVIAAGPGNAPKGVWEDIREFDLLQLPLRDTVVRGMPEDAADGELVTWEAVINGIGTSPSERARYTEEVVEKFIQHVESLRGEVDRSFIRSVDGLTFLPVALTTSDVSEAAAFNALRAIRPMPRMRDLEVMFRSATVAPETPMLAAAEPPVLKPRTSERIAVFDGGVDLNDPALAPYVTLHSLTTEQVARAIRHGTMVTSAILYGYAAVDADGAQSPVALVDHYQVIPPPKAVGVVDTEFYWVLDQIVKYSVGHDHRIVNLSLGPPRCMEEDAEPHAWTATLDEIAKQYGILFVCAVGNNGAFERNRIRVPADMANGLAVGACRSRDAAARVQRADYSALGPGRAGQRVAPLGVAFGGSLADSTPFRARGPGGRPENDEGTSFATPLVSHGIADLRAMLDSPRPDTLRAFAAHFVQGRPARGHDARHIGYGRLRETYADVWDCGPNAITVLYDVEMRKGELLALPLPMPGGIRPDAEVRIVFTVCYSSEVQAQHASDYTRSGLDITFRPHDQMFTAYDASTKPLKRIGTFHVERDQDALAEIAKTRPIKMSAHPLAKSGWRRSRWEGDQRDAGKWDTLVRADWPFAARELRGARVDLEYHARDGVRLMGPDAPVLPVTVLITVEGPTDVPLYDLVQPQLQSLVPLVRSASEISVPLPLRP
jgi:hypothetical protein